MLREINNTLKFSTEYVPDSCKLENRRESSTSDLKGSKIVSFTFVNSDYHPDSFNNELLFDLETE
jgi:hypothetical protein